MCELIKNNMNIILGSNNQMGPTLTANDIVAFVLLSSEVVKVILLLYMAKTLSS